PIPAEERRAVARSHRDERRDDDLGREGDRAASGGGNDGAVVIRFVGGSAARPVGVKRPRAAVDGQSRGERAIARRQPPRGRAILTPTLWICRCVGPLRERRTARVLEVVDATCAGIVVLYAVKVDPNVRILMTEERGELDELAPVEPAPLVRL